MRHFNVSFGLFVVLTTVNCFQNKRNSYDDDNRGFMLRNESARGPTGRPIVSHFIIPGSNELPDSFNSIAYKPHSFNKYKPNKRQFAKEALAAHNKYRRTSPHYGTALVLDGKLCRDAQRYADKLARRGGGLQNARATGQGENLSGPSYGRVTAKSVVEGWYREKHTGRSCKQHYTQLVWKKSVRFCMAMAVNKYGGVYTVARYFPAGNLPGARNYQVNVHPGFKDPCSGLEKPSKPSTNTPKPSRPSIYTPKPHVTTETPTNFPDISAKASEFGQAGIEAHNKRRRTSPHYGTDLILDENLCRDAQNYAEILARRNSGLQHSKRNTRRGHGGQGENLTYYKQGTRNGKPYGRVDADFFVQGWFSEKDTGEKCMGHYSALVWKKSVRSCMAFAKSRDGAYFVVARYSPPGNVQGNKNYRENVHPGFTYPC